ncbi:unnamed protein product [Rhodiola kirilowii]
MASFAKLYLVLYNALQAAGWAVALFRILSNFAATKSVNGAYSSAGELICFLQTVSFLEVIHGGLGLVPSGVFLPLMQWGGRVHFVLAIVKRLDELHEYPAVFITFVAWSLSELIRYPHYAMQCLGTSPAWFTYIRYTAFIVLYPIGGVIGEMWLMYQALPLIKEKKLYSGFFFGVPFNYYQFILALLLVYPLLLLKLYLHMFKQRRSKLLHKHHEKKQS